MGNNARVQLPLSKSRTGLPFDCPLQAPEKRRKGWTDKPQLDRLNGVDRACQAAVQLGIRPSERRPILVIRAAHSVSVFTAQRDVAGSVATLYDGKESRTGQESRTGLMGSVQQLFCHRWGVGSNVECSIGNLHSERDHRRALRHAWRSMAMLARRIASSTVSWGCVVTSRC